MNQTMRVALATLAGAAALTSTGCTFDPIQIDKVFCGADVDCPASNICVDGVCVPFGVPGADVSSDVGGPDDPDAGADAENNVTFDCSTDEDGDGFFVGPGCPPSRIDCRDDDRDIYPGAPTRCNGMDNDCDGREDSGACGCQDGEERACGTNEGACVQGKQVCVDGAFGDCVDQIGPAEEVCDGQDNDCDGEVDELPPVGAQDCEIAGQLGACAEGVLECADGELTCIPQTQPAAEVCDGQDNDCDGDVDEDDARLALSRPCGAGTCPDLAVQLCEAGQWQPCGATDVEVCDGADSNCDQTADNISRCVFVCGDVTISGTQTCDGGQGKCELPEELCDDGVDNDCNGTIDDGCANGAGTRMLYIPGGTFVMGALTSDGDRQSDEEPARIVTLSPYYIDRTEVSRAEYFACVMAGACAAPDTGGGCTQQSFNGVDGELPIACVRHRDARDYCGWVGKRLPTEAEWEKAARGPYRQLRRYPWGDDADVSRAVMDCQGGLDTCVQPVGSFTGSASPYGMLHAAGNVAEYVADFYDPFFYQASSSTDPERDGFTFDGRAVRGGSWRQEIDFGRVTNRAAQTFGNIDVVDLGFRCARTR